MKHFYTLIRSIPLVLAITVASGSVVWSPIACSCLPAWMTIAHGLGRFDVKSDSELTARFVADNMLSAFTGKIVTAGDLPFATSTYDCADSTSPSRHVRCRWWLWESGRSKKGYDVVVFTTAKGVFQRATVTPIQYLDPIGRT